MVETASLGLRIGPLLLLSASRVLCVFWGAERLICGDPVRYGYGWYCLRVHT